MEPKWSWLGVAFICLFTCVICVNDIDFAERLIAIYGTNGTLSVEQLQKLLDKLKTKESGVHHHKTGETQGTHSTENNVLHENDSCQNSTSLACSTTSKCLGADDIFKYHNVGDSDVANVTSLQLMSPMILYEAQNDNCQQNVTFLIKQRPSHAEVWGFSFLCVTLINLCALMGLVFMPLMRRSFYQRLLMYMVALAVGTLAGSSILFLLPEAFGLREEEGPLSESYIWKSTTILGGIYMFFLVERVLKLIMEWRVRKQDEKLSVHPLAGNHRNGRGRIRTNSGMDSLQDLPLASVKTRDIHLEESMNMYFKPPRTSMKGSKSHQGLTSSQATTPTTECESLANEEITNGAPANGIAVTHAHSHQPIKAVAWMVVFGDGLHNFIDGLSIGAAFTQSTLSGISISLAVICEELPHELGDFAILLNSGMTMKQALSYNFLSACMCYLGLVFGIILGENTEGSQWVFAVASGMFLYISLVDMLPEVNHAAEEEEKEKGKIWPIFLLQNAGILTGYGIMVFLAVFGGRIDLNAVL